MYQLLYKIFHQVPNVYHEGRRHESDGEGEGVEGYNMESK